jgi:ABC-2 type transport system ATP-binding protein
LIEVKNLTKRYGNHTAVSDLSFTIGDGQIYGLLGPNGAGKTTTMNILTGCLAATSGEVRIDGFDIFEEADKAKRLIGYLPEQPPLYLDRTPAEYLDFVGEAKGLRGPELKKQVAAVMETTRITGVADRLIKNLSKGYRQRVGIAQAILGDPKIIILDEPTVGLDPRQIIEMRELIKGLGETHTVILSSHILSEVQAVCTTVMIISEGRLVACDTPENLERLFAGAATVELTAEAGEAEARAALSGVAGAEDIKTSEQEGGRCAITLQTSRDDSICRDIFFAFSAIGRPILRMETSRASLEQIFIELTGGEPRAPEQASSPETAPAAAAETAAGDGKEADAQ